MKPDENLGTAENTSSSLYHYTSQNGLLNIIKHKKMWATHIRYLNDASEWLYPEELFRNNFNELLDRLLNNLYASHELRAIRNGPLTKAEEMENFLSICKPLFLSNEEILDVFVCSFSAKKDDLSQWRGYCPNGNGFCVGFDLSKLVKQAETQVYTIKQCEYDPKIHMDQIENLLNAFKTNLENTDNKFTSHLLLLIRKFYAIAPFIKHESFKNEQEWRIVNVLMGEKFDIKFREGKSMIAPYIEFKLAEEELIPINEIIVGPAPHMKLSQHSVKTMLMIHGFDEDSVNKIVTLSKVPYRAW